MNNCQIIFNKNLINRNVNVYANLLNQSVKYIAVKKRKHFTETNIKQIQKDESLCDHTIGQ